MTSVCFFCFGDLFTIFFCRGLFLVPPVGIAFSCVWAGSNGRSGVPGSESVGYLACKCLTFSGRPPNVVLRRLVVPGPYCGVGMMTSCCWLMIWYVSVDHKFLGRILWDVCSERGQFRSVDSRMFVRLKYECIIVATVPDLWSLGVGCLKFNLPSSKGEGLYLDWCVPVF